MKWIIILLCITTAVNAQKFKTDRVQIFNDKSESIIYTYDSEFEIYNHAIRFNGVNVFWDKVKKKKISSLNIKLDDNSKATVYKTDYSNYVLYYENGELNRIEQYINDGEIKIIFYNKVYRL